MITEEKLICIVVCTYNRGYILIECLNSLVHQTLGKEAFNVLVVDNNSSDNTREVGLDFAQRYTHFSYTLEENIGLSNARNRGYQEANATWIGYLDDDAKAHTNYVERALWIMNNYNFDAFGGRYLPWYKYGKPRWIPENFGTNGRLLDTIGVLPEGNISGGVSFFKKHILQEMGGFPTELGMSGKKMSYGEETLLLVRMRQAGHTVGFDPDLNIDHLVNTYKLSPWWIIKSFYKKGIYYWQGHRIAKKQASGLYMAVEVVSLTFKRLLVATWRLPRQNYYWQNWLIDGFSEPALALGRLMGKVSRSS